MLLRWMSGDYEFTGLPVVGANASIKLNLNELIAGSGISADKGSIELEYIGRAGALTAINHINGQKQYDIEFKDTLRYGSGLLTVPYFIVSAHDDTKVWLQNTKADAVTIVMNYYSKAGGTPTISEEVTLAGYEWRQISVAEVMGNPVVITEGSIELIPATAYSVVGHSAIEHFNKQYAEDIGIKDPAYARSKQLHGSFWIDEQTQYVDLRTRVYVHNNASTGRSFEIVREYAGTSRVKQYAIAPHGTRVIELEDDTVPPLYEAGFEIEQREGQPGDIVASASVINVMKDAAFQVAVSSNYCGVPSKLENRGFEMVCDDAKIPPVCVIVGYKMAHIDYMSESQITGYRLHYGYTQGQWEEYVEYEELAEEFLVEFACSITGWIYYAIEVMSNCGEIPLSNVVEVAAFCIPAPLQQDKGTHDSATENVLDSDGSVKRVQTGITQELEDGAIIM
ncbi:MAG: hypothetical protein A2Y62_07715 [Candidatus Fischerbacteria bacterium RBG_13_37_8]|uniref:Uncharacterized protein n=1 Tax=Candidatus Fischerbacteria bacterium RBG_13_37_8 TaxID=1817863 RepID=A0A1F5V917_9BACT|nr:MAG: hypothetical protein A2Y62_07715 [Candidatus Fischerbacteria bacterium RBG_13_37_8]